MAIERNRLTRQGATSVESIPYIFLAILAAAFLIRLIVALRSGVQVDESRMVYAIDTIAHSGRPVLGSDVLYLVGTPVNYLFAPFGWVFSGLDLLHAVRIGNALLSSTAVFVLWRLALEMTGNLAIAMGVSIIAAFDPMGLYWGTIASMNASLALIALLVVYSAFRVVSEPDESVLRRTDGSNPIVWLVFWLLIGSLTYYAIWLFVPAILIACVVRWKREVFRARHPVRIAFEVAIIFPILVWMFGSLVGPGSGSSFNPGPPGFNQIWNNWERLRDFDFNFEIWQSLYYGSRYAKFVPLLIALATGAIAAWYFLRSRIADRDRGAGRIATAAVVLVVGSYWLPILIVANGSLPEIVLGVLPFGYLIVGIALWLMIPDWQVSLSRRSVRIAPPVIVAGILLLPVIVFILQGARWQLDYQTPDPDYYAATEHVDSVRQSDQYILTPFPAIAWMVMDEFERNRIVPLAGPADGQRIGNEARDLSSRGVDDYYVDYWTGQQAIGSQGLLCHYLLYVTPPPLILVDTRRLDAEWAFGGEFGTAIKLGTQILAQGDNGIEVRQPIALDQWSPEAQTACGIQPGTAT
jgi:hypothetical protein